MPTFKILLITVILVYFIATMIGCADHSVPPPISSKVILPTQCSPVSLDLGELTQGETKNGKFVIFNNSKNEITIDHVNVSCDCLSVKPELSAILAGGNITVDVSMDSSKEPDFAGALEISVEGYAKNGDRVFEIRVRINVISR